MISKGELGLSKITCSEGAMNLLQSLLSIYANERPVAAAALLHPWLSTTVGLSTTNAPPTVLLDLTKNEDRIALIFKRLILVGYLRKHGGTTTNKPLPLPPLTLHELSEERRTHNDRSESRARRTKKLDMSSLEGVWAKEASKSKLQGFTRERASYQDSKTFSVSHLKKPYRSKNLPEIVNIGSPRKEKPRILANILDKRSGNVFATMEEKGYSSKRSPDKPPFHPPLREGSGGGQNFFMRQSLAEAKVVIGRSRNSPIKQTRPTG